MDEAKAVSEFRRAMQLNDAGDDDGCDAIFEALLGAGYDVIDAVLDPAAQEEIAKQVSGQPKQLVRELAANPPEKWIARHASADGIVTEYLVRAEEG